jgi:hypothetical protein
MSHVNSLLAPTEFSSKGSWESDATWEREDYLRDGYKEFYQQWYAFQISVHDFYKGGGL